MARVRDPVSEQVLTKLGSAASLFAMLVLLPPSTATAQDVGCSRDPVTGVLECVVVKPPESPDVEQEIGNTVGPPLKWSRTRIQDNVGAPPSCSSREVDTPTGPVLEWGVPWLIVIQNTETGDFVLIRLECQYSGEDPPEPPPPPPDLAEIATDQGAAFALETGLNPPQERRGVSQLPTWLWCSNAGPVDVEATVWPHRASAHAVVTNVTWTIEGPDGSIERSAEDCGSEPDPDSDGSAAAATWTPNEPGVSTITLTTEWSAQWTYTYFDPVLGAVNLGTFDLGAIVLASEPIAYEVYEIQSVGVAP